VSTVALSVVGPKTESAVHRTPNAWAGILVRNVSVEMVCHVYIMSCIYYYVHELIKFIKIIYVFYPILHIKFKC
jgi:hypothetical protein